MTKLTVKTFDDNALVEASRQLNALVFKDFLPDIIVGIRTGGYVVAEIMAREAAHRPTLLAISKQRSSTKNKSAIKDILRHLPYCITNQLRIVEHKILNSNPQPETKVFTPNAEELAKLQAALLGKEGLKILVVDDALDSGNTMKAVLELVQKEAKNSLVKTAAITTTTENPILRADYSLYNLVLCRFSWAFDFKK